MRRDLEAATFRVQKVEARERKRNPVPPFITSKLQQEAFKKLRFTVKKTMQVAQRLYEGVELGDRRQRRPDHVHAHRLHAHLRRRAGRPCASASPSNWGAEYVPERPIFYRSKKDAQDAHEAIRPTYFDRDPESIKRYLSKDEYALYKLIWNRFLASQMKPAVYDETVVDIEAGRVPAARARAPP